MSEEINSWREAPELVEKIEAYLKYDGPTSYTEMLEGLCRLAYHMDYMSDEFQAALVKELKDCLKIYEENTEIVESEQTITHKVKEVIWN